MGGDKAISLDEIKNETVDLVSDSSYPLDRWISTVFDCKNRSI